MSNNQRRGDGGGKVSPELALFFNELDRLSLGYTITSTTRNKDTHPDKYSETSPHFTGHGFDLGYKNENDNLGLLKYLFGEDFDPKVKVDGDYVRPDLTPEGIALFKRHNIRMIDERNLVNNEHFHFEAVDSTKAKKINKMGDDFTFDSSPRKGKRYASDTQDFYFYGGAVGEFTENELNTNIDYKDTIPNGDFVIIGDSLKSDGKNIPFTWSEAIDEDTRNSFNKISGFDVKQEDPTKFYPIKPSTDFKIIDNSGDAGKIAKTVNGINPNNTNNVDQIDSNYIEIEEVEEDDPDVVPTDISKKIVSGNKNLLKKDDVDPNDLDFNNETDGTEGGINNPKNILKIIGKTGGGISTASVVTPVNKEKQKELSDEEWEKSFEVFDGEIAIDDPDIDDSKLLDKIRRKDIVGGKDNFESDDFVFQRGENKKEEKVVENKKEEKKEVKSFDPNGITDYLNTPTETEIKYQKEQLNKGDTWLDQIKWNNERKKLYEDYNQGMSPELVNELLANDETYQKNKYEIDMANKAYQKVSRFVGGDGEYFKTDVEGMDLTKALFAGIESETMDFPAFNQQMKVEILNLIPKEEWKRIAEGENIKNVLGINKEELFRMAKTSVLANHASTHQGMGIKLRDSQAIQMKDEEAFFEKQETLKSDYADVQQGIYELQQKHGAYRWSPRGRMIYTQSKKPSENAKEEFKSLNDEIKNLDLRRKELNDEGSILKESREFLDQKINKFQTSYEAAWIALGWDMALPLDRQPPTWKGTAISEAWDKNRVKKTDSFLGGTFEIAGILAEEYGRYKALISAGSKWQTWVGLGLGYGGAALVDKAKPEAGADDGVFKGYSYKDKYLDFLGDAVSIRVMPRNNIERLYNSEYIDTGSFLEGLFDRDAYNFTPYTVSKTIAELLPYTLNIIQAGRGASSMVARQQKFFNKAKLSHFPKGHKYHKNLGQKIITGINKFYKPNLRVAQGISMISVNHRMLLLDNLADARANGLKGTDAIFYANLTTLATGVSQLVMPDVNFMRSALTGRGLLKSLIKDIKNNGAKSAMGQVNKEAYSAITKQFGTQFFKEHAEEQLDVILNDLVKANYLADYSPDFFKASVQREVLLGTSLLTGSLGVVQAASTTSNVKTAMYNAISKEGDSILAASGLEIEELKKNIEKYRKLNKRHPKNKNWKSKFETFTEALEIQEEAHDAVRNVMQAMNAAPEYATISMIDLLIKKNALLGKKKELLKKDKAVNQNELNDLNEKLKKLDEQIIKENPTAWKENLYTMSIKRGVSLLGKLKIDVNVIELTEKEYIEKIKERNSEIAAENDERRKEGKREKAYLDHGGNATVIYDDIGNKPIIIINTDSAKGKDGNYGVGVHEVFHLVMRKTVLKNPKMIKGLSYLLRRELLLNPQKYKYSDRFGYVEGKMSTYEDDVNGMQWDEMFTVISEALVQGDIKLETNFLTKISDVIRRLFREAGMTRLTISPFADPAKGMLNFIRDYNRELLGNRTDFSRGMRNIVKNGLKIKVDKSFIKKAEELEKEANLPEWGGQAAFASASTRGGRIRQKNVYERKDLQQDIKLKESTQRIVDENARIRQELLDTRRQLDDGSFEYDEDLRNDLVLNNMALVTALSDFAAKNPKIMGLEEGKKVGFAQFQSGFSKELINLSQSYDPALIPFGAYLNRLLPLRYGDVLKSEQKGAIEGSVSIDNENVGEMEDTSTPTDFDDAPRFTAPKYNVAKEIGDKENQDIQEEVNQTIAEGLADLKEYSDLVKNKGDEKRINELKKKLEEKHMIDLDLDTMELSNVEGLTYKTIARLSGIDVEKLNPRSKKFLANLRKKEGKAGSNEVRSGQRFIAKHAQLILSTIFNEGHTKAFKSTNMPNVLLKFGYNKGSKRIKNNFPQYKKPNLSEKEFLEYLGIYRVTKNGRKGFEFQVDRNTSAKITAVLSLLDRTITNQSLRKSLEATGDLDERLKNALEDGLAASAQATRFTRFNEVKQTGVRQRMPEIAIALDDLDPEITQARMITALSKIFTKDGLLTKEEARGLLKEMFKESGVIKQYQYVKGNLESQGIEMIPFEEFSNKYLEVQVYVGLIEKYKLTKPVYDEKGNVIGEEVPTQKEVFDIDAVKRGRNIASDYVQSIISRWKASIGTDNEMSIKEVLMEIAMEEQNHVTAYKIGGGGSYFIAGTNKDVKTPKGESGTPRFQLFHSKEGPKADFRKFIYQFMDQDFIDAMEKDSPGSSEIFRDGKTENFVEIKLEPQDGKGVITHMVNLIKKVTRKDARKYDQKLRDKETDLSRKVLVNKLIFLADSLNAGLITEHDYVVQMMTLMSNPTTTLRRAGKVVGIMDGIINPETGEFLLGDKISNSEIRYEHQKPASYLLMKIIDITSDQKNRENWESLIEKEMIDYNVSIITQVADKTLDVTNRKTLMGEEYNENGYGKPFGSMLRMFNPMNKGDKNVKPIRLIDDILNKREGQVFGLGHDIASELFPKPMYEIEVDKKISKVTQSANSLKYNRNSRGMSAFDFDETVGISDNYIIATKEGEETKRIPSNEWPIVGDQLVKEGWKMDFTDFNKVTNGKPGPLMQKMKNQIKKFGPKNVFILTARAPESQAAIHAYLESEGIKIPIENITGLGNSTGEAKALWMLERFAEGYNDMYFVDDALPNVKAVKNVLSQLDIKSKVQQAVASKSTDYSREFNKIIEENEGIEAEKRFSKAKAARRGQEKDSPFNIFIPPSAEDFIGLIYTFLGKGKLGEKQFKFFQEALIKPLNRAYKMLNEAKQNIANSYNALTKKMPQVKKILNKKIEGFEDYTYQDAIRVYLWDKNGFVIPGLSETDQAKLVALVNSDENLKAFAETLGTLSMQEEGYVRPMDEWLVGSIKTDLMDASQGVNRKLFFAEFLENVGIIFSEENMNKIEATYGKGFREALEDMLFRIENGTNRNFGTENRLVNRFMNWLNGAIGTTMFFNSRSALLQTLSTVNFINWEDNNILAASKAFANQKQFWADFTMLFNSNMLKQRRSGLGMDINAQELAEYVANASGPMAKYKAALNFILSKGFLPTQMADSFAIAAGGATFYRNRYNKYLSEGSTVEEAKEKAFNDFQAIAEETQQSARPDMISQQQASVLGRLILAFQNTPMQYTRLMKKAILDLVNGRGDAKSNISRIIYYGAVQNLIFYSLQTALFAMMFDDEDDEEFFDKKKGRVLSGTVDSTLRGMGVGGAVVSTLKNMIIAFHKEQQKNYNKDESAVIMELANLSPPIGIKLRKIREGERAIQWNKDLIEELPYYNLKNPVWEAGFAFTQAATNVPLSRLHGKVENLSGMFQKDLETWQRIALFMGWSKWNIGVGEKRKGKSVKKTIRR